MIRIPSKSFLVGEYAVLSGGPGAVLVTEPMFQLTTMLESNDEGQKAFDPNSPAGKYIQAHPELTHMNWHLQDPHDSKGGFGASTAAYGAVFQYHHQLDPTSIDIHIAKEIIDEYQHYAYMGEGPKPSGADLIAQILGKHCIFHREADLLTTFEWPFEQWAFELKHTGYKLPTHEHLFQSRYQPDRALIQWAGACCDAILNRDPSAFVHSLERFVQRQIELGLVTEHSQQLIKTINQKTINQSPNVIIAKGCGAMGADVILTIYEEKVV